jgi:hypothetical protein
MDFQCLECFEYSEEWITPCSICGSDVVVPVDSLTDYEERQENWRN